MNGKKTLVLILVLILSSALIASCANQPTPVPTKPLATTAPTEAVKLSGIVTEWGSLQDWEKDLIAEFNKKYPDIKIDYVNVPAGADMQTKVLTTISSGGELPDLLCTEIKQLTKFKTLDIFADLSAAPFNVDKTMFADYLVQILTDGNGKFIGLPQGLTPGGFYYRRDLAKLYLGTDDPEQIKNYTKTWDDFIAAGETIVKNSGGKVYALPGIGDDLWNVLFMPESKPWIDENRKLLIEENYIDIFRTIDKIKSKKIEAGLESWSTPWAQSFSNGSVVFFPGASWYPDFVIKGNDPDGSGRWGYVTAPKPFTWGGTFWCITKESKKAELAYAYISYIFATQEGNLFKYKTKNDLPGIKALFDSPELQIPSAFFSGQILAPYYKDVLSVTKFRDLTEFDSAFEEARAFEFKAVAIGAITAEQAAANMENDLLEKIEGSSR